MVFAGKGLTPLVLYGVAVMLLMGAGIGVAATALAYRSRFSKGIAARAAALGGITFVLVGILVGWADSNSEGSLLRLEIAQHGLVFAVVSSSLVALLAGAKRPKTNEPLDVGRQCDNRFRITVQESRLAPNIGLDD